VTLEGVTGSLDTFIVEPMSAFSAEYYICIHSLREYDEMLFYHEGGVDVGDVDAKAVRRGGRVVVVGCGSWWVAGGRRAVGERGNGSMRRRCGGCGCKGGEEGRVGKRVVEGAGRVEAIGNEGLWLGLGRERVWRGERGERLG
jgi:hypothetical protein